MTNKKINYLNISVLLLFLYSIHFAITSVFRVDLKIGNLYFLIEYIVIYSFFVGSLLYLRKNTDSIEEQKQYLQTNYVFLVSIIWTLSCGVFDLGFTAIYQLFNFIIFVCFAMLFGLLNNGKKLSTLARSEGILVCVLVLMLIQSAIVGLFAPLVYDHILLGYVFLGLIWLTIVYLLWLRGQWIKKNHK